MKINCFYFMLPTFIDGVLTNELEDGSPELSLHQAEPKLRGVLSLPTRYDLANEEENRLEDGFLRLLSSDDSLSMSMKTTASPTTISPPTNKPVESPMTSGPSTVSPVAQTAAPAGGSTSSPVTMGTAPPASSLTSITEFLENDPSFTMLLLAIQKAGYERSLAENDRTKLTLIAPENIAFSQLPVDLMALLFSNDEYIPHLQDVILNHIVVGEVRSSNSVDSVYELEAANEAVLTITTAPFAVNGVAVSQPDNIVSNGIVQGVEGMLLPEWTGLSIADRVSMNTDLTRLAELVGKSGLDLASPGPFTLLGPTDAAFARVPDETISFLMSPEGLDSLRELLLYHVLEGIIPSRQLVPDNFATVAIDRLVSNNANLLSADGYATNGVLHLIDRVLTPPVPEPTTTNAPTQGPMSVPTQTLPPTPTPMATEVSGEFCWKNSFGRGVGSIPDQCPEDRDQRGLLCYSKCPEGFTNPPGTVDCHQVCPEGWRDDGLFCRLAEYGRGVGYPAWDWDRCESDNGVGNCEWHWGIIYPKCAEGFSNAACCICRPDVPDCGALGFSGQLDLSCTKTIILGDPTLRGCAEGLEYDGGLCYTPCGEGFDGIGPVCWGQPPPGWVNCGFGASPDDSTCGKINADQVLSVGQTVVFIATLGTSSAAQPIVKGSPKYEELLQKFREFQSKLPNILENHPNVEKTYELAVLGKSLADVARLDPELEEPEDLVRFVTTLTSVFDPTGVSSIIAAYTFAMCSDLLDDTDNL